MIEDENQRVLFAKLGLGRPRARCRRPPRATDVSLPRQPLGWRRWRGGGCLTVWGLGMILFVEDNLLLLNIPKLLTLANNLSCSCQAQGPAPFAALRGDARVLSSVLNQGDPFKYSR